MSQLMQLLLSHWELDPQAIDACDLPVDIRASVISLCAMGVLRDAPDAKSWTCTECGHRSHLNFIVDKAGIAHAFSCCTDCGPNKIDAQLLKRWVIDTRKLLEILFCKTKLAIQQRGNNPLWQVGRATWAGRSREIWFVRSFRPSNTTSILSELGTSPNAIVFTPTFSVADRLRAKIENLVIPLDSIVELHNGEFCMDRECVESKIKDRELSAKPKRTPTPRRAEKLVGIDKLKDELNAHMISARDHAIDTKQRTGEPALLPRPLQKDLAKRAGISKTAVSRRLCDLGDPELQILWNAADNLYDVMNWETSKKLKRKK